MQTMSPCHKKMYLQVKDSSIQKRCETVKLCYPGEATVRRRRCTIVAAEWAVHTEGQSKAVRVGARSKLAAGAEARWADEERRAIRPWSVPAKKRQREAARYRVFAEDSSFRY